MAKRHEKIPRIALLFRQLTPPQPTFDMFHFSRYKFCILMMRVVVLKERERERKTERERERESERESE